MQDLLPNSLECPWTVQKWVLNQVSTLCGARVSGSRYESPMILPSSWHPQQSLKQLKEHTYFVTEKYDGVRYYLFLVAYNQKPFAFMINRKGSVYYVSVSARFDYFKGSLFEGELVFNQQTNKQEFYVFDVVALHGVHVHNIEQGYLFGERIQWVRDVFGGIPYDRYTINQSSTWKLVVDQGFQNQHEWRNKIISMGNHYSLQFFPKFFYTVSSYDPITLANKSIPNDGYIFIPHFCPILPPHADQPRTWKWKPDVTIDVWLSAGNPHIYLMYKQQREPLKTVQSGAQTFRCQWEEKEKQNPIVTSVEWQIVECTCRIQGRSLVFWPVRIRHDKSFPNSMKTFFRTLPSLFHPIPIEHVFKITKKTTENSTPLENESQRPIEIDPEHL